MTADTQRIAQWCAAHGYGTRVFERLMRGLDAMNHFQRSRFRSHGIRALADFEFPDQEDSLSKLHTWATHADSEGI